MNQQQSSNTDGLSVADSLRQIAAWLDEHPEQQVKWGIVRLNATDRADLEALAAAFGDEATEAVKHGMDVRISREFGDVEVFAEVPLSKLGVVTVPAPVYEPILSEREEQAA